MSDAHAYGRIRAGSLESMFWYTISMCRCTRTRSIICVWIDAFRLRGGRPGALPLGTPIRCMGVPSAWRACLREDQSRQFGIHVLAYHKHVPMHSIEVDIICRGSG